MGIVRLIARHVPVKLVERRIRLRRVVIANRVAHAIADEDGTIGVGRARYVDVIATRPAVIDRLILDAQRLASRIGDGAILDVQLRPPALRGVVLEGKIAIEAVPLTGETDRELFDDIHRAVGMDGEERREVADADVALLLRARLGGERAESER